MGDGSRRDGGVIAGVFARPWVRLVAGNVAVAVGYWCLAMLGSVVQYTGNIQVAWLPVGYAAAMLYLGDLRWFVGGALADLVIGPNFIPFDGVTLNAQNVVMTVGNTLEFVIIAALMRRWLGRRNELERPVDVGLLLVAVGIGTAVSAVIGNLAAVQWGGLAWSDFGSSVRTWWLGDTSGGLLVAPLMLVWWNGPRHLDLRPRQVAETLLILGLVAGVSVAVFSSHHPLTYLVVPTLLLAAVYLGQRGVTVALVLAYAVAVGMTAANVGPFVSTSIDDQTLRTQLYILVSIVATLLLGAAVSERRRAAVALAEASRREAELAAEERRRIARDLHDSVSQTLFSLGLHVGIAKHELARMELESGSTLGTAVEEVAELAHGALLEMRASIFDLRGEAVSEQGLVAALGAHGAGLAVRYDVRVTVDGPAERLPLEPASEELLFLIGREAVTNAVKHSGSPTVSVTVAIEDAEVALVIRDDGTGFDPSLTYSGHLGLELMRAHAADAGGSVTIESAAEAGTSVRAVVPADGAAMASRPALPAPQIAPPVSVS